MERYLLVKELFNDSFEICYRSCLFTVEPNGTKEIWDIVKMETEQKLDDFIREVYGITPPPVNSEIAFDSTKAGMP